MRVLAGEGSEVARRPSGQRLDRGGDLRRDPPPELRVHADDLRFSVDDLVAEADRVAIRWTLRGTNTGPLLGQPPTGEPVELAAIVIFRLADGKIAERWAAWKRPPA